MRENVLRMLDNSCNNSLKIALALEQEIKEIMKLRAKLVALREKACTHRVYRDEMWSIEEAIDNVVNRTVLDT